MRATLRTSANKAPEVFDPVPCLIAADLHMRNLYKNYGLLGAKGLFRLIKMAGSLSQTSGRTCTCAVQRPAGRAAVPVCRRVVPPNRSIPTPSSACAYPARLVSAAIRTMFQIRVLLWI